MNKKILIGSMLMATTAVASVSANALYFSGDISAVLDNFIHRASTFTIHAKEVNKEFQVNESWRVDFSELFTRTDNNVTHKITNTDNNPLNFRPTESGIEIEENNVPGDYTVDIQLCQPGVKLPEPDILDLPDFYKPVIGGGGWEWGEHLCYEPVLPGNPYNPFPCPSEPHNYNFYYPSMGEIFNPGIYDETGTVIY